MGKGYKHGGSGGANPLNFTVKTYPSETELKADKPKENTIGVITTTTMTSWVFSATEPTEPEVGMVWFSYDYSSKAEFDALKKNTLQVYPHRVKQGENGQFVDKVAYSYIDGEWIDWWNGELFDNGKQFETVTGGWTNAGYDNNESKYTLIAPTISDKLYLKNSGALTRSVAGTVNKIDLSKYKTVTFDVSSASGNSLMLYASPSKNPYDTGYAARTGWISSTGEANLDVSSLTDSYYIVCSVYSSEGGGVQNFAISKVTLKE